MKLSLNDMRMFVLLYFLIFVWLWGCITESRILIWGTVVLVQMIIVKYCANRISIRIGLLLFMIFLFIMTSGNYFLFALENEKISGWSIDFEVSLFDEIKASAIILSGIVSAFLGSVFFEGSKLKKYRCHFCKNRLWNIEKLKKSSLIIFYVGALLTSITTLENTIFKMNYGYTASYAIFEPTLPSIIYGLDGLMWPAFFLYCSCLPNKKSFFKPACVCVMVTLLSMAGGARHEFVLTTAVILFYVVVRNFVYNYGESWFGKKQKKMIVFFIPILLASCIVVGVTRYNASLDRIGIEYIAHIIVGNGNGFLILDELKYHDMLPKQNYTFGKVIVYVDNIGRKILGEDVPVGNNREYNAKYGHNFAASMTYLILPIEYIKGSGFGSSYLVETFHDYGILGVIIFSFLYGVILCSVPIYLRKTHNPFFIAMLFLMVKGILFAPRSATTAFLTDSFISFWNLIAFCMIWFVYSVRIHFYKK